MNNKKHIVPDSIAMHPHLFAFDVVIRELMAELEVHKLLIYFFDTVDASLLPVLAEQLDVLGPKGWDYAATEKDKRELLKKAITLKRYKGTPWAVIEAVKVAGYTVFEYLENVNNNWGTFRIRIDLANYPMDTAKITEAVALVEAYKRKSAWFEGFYFHGLRFEDSVTMDDDFGFTAANHITDTMTTEKQITRDGSILRDGTQNYSTETDTLRLRIV